MYGANRNDAPVREILINTVSVCEILITTVPVRENFDNCFSGTRDFDNYKLRFVKFLKHVVIVPKNISF